METFVSLKRTAVTSVMWSALENASTTLIAFLSLVILAKLVGPQDFGVYSVALSIIEIAGIFTNMFFYEALIQSSKVEDRHFDGAFTASIVISVSMFGLVWFIFPLVASLIGDIRIITIGQVLACSLILTGPMSIFGAKLAREFVFRILALRTFVGRVVGALIGIAAALYGMGVWALV